MTERKGGLGMGFGVSIILMAVGAILTFAVHASADGVDLDTVGVILILLGLLGLLAGVVWWEDRTPDRPLDDEDWGDVVVRRRPRAVVKDDFSHHIIDVTDERAVDVGADRPVAERRRLTTRRTSSGRF